MMYPVGQLCYVVSDPLNQRPGLLANRSVGRVVEVVGYGHRSGCDCDLNRGVCHVRYSNGKVVCCDRWTLLRPITPPPQTTDTTRDEPVTAEA